MRARWNYPPCVQRCNKEGLLSKTPKRALEGFFDRLFGVSPCSAGLPLLCTPTPAGRASGPRLHHPGRAGVRTRTGQRPTARGEATPRHRARRVEQEHPFARQFFSQENADSSPAGTRAEGTTAPPGPAGAASGPRLRSRGVGPPVGLRAAPAPAASPAAGAGAAGPPPAQPEPPPSPSAGGRCLRGRGRRAMPGGAPAPPSPSRGR